MTLEDGLRAEADKEGKYPKIVSESFQVIECTWDDSLDGAAASHKRRIIT